MIPQDVDVAFTWPARKTTTATAKPARICEKIDFPTDVVVVLDSSNFNNDQFDKLKESVSTFVDESFDLSPDVARIGFVVYRYA